MTGSGENLAFARPLPASSLASIQCVAADPAKFYQNFDQKKCDTRSHIVANHFIVRGNVGRPKGPLYLRQP